MNCVLGDVALNAGSANSFQKNYTNIMNAVDNQRLSVSGVDNDEEALNLVKYQNAYNLSAKMIQVLMMTAGILHQVMITAAIGLRKSLTVIQMLMVMIMFFLIWKKMNIAVVIRLMFYTVMKFLKISVLRIYLLRK